MLPAGLPPTAPAQAPEGRFHHSGQIAAYASLSAEGALVAITRYLPDGPARVLHRTLIVAAHVADHRGEARASAVWQDIRAGGAPAPTWAFSDAARAAGAQAMLYSSRTRPELTHIVMFDLTCLHHTP
ncbi:MAG: RES family NAD+ phosphorylase [Pseudomonadota bacterium]